MSGQYENEQRELSAGLASLAAEDRGLSAPPSLESLLIAALPKSRRSRRINWAVAGSIAAALLVALWVVTHRPVQPAPAHEPRRASTYIRASVPAAQAPQPVSSEAALETRIVRPRQRLRRTHAASSRRTSPAELAVNTGTPFFPLPFSEPLGASESGEVWRVRLLRSTMASFGLPVSVARLNDTIEADVIVGQDGSPRAIRFLP